MAKIALSMPREAIWNRFRHVGFGTARQLGFPGEAAGKLRHYRSWRPIEQATMAYGMGISVSLVQLAHAYTVFARDGELVPLSLVKTGTAASGEKLLSTETARAMRAMLELDRKSTRLNSSHSQISYAVFCLKKKKTSCSLTGTPEAVASWHFTLDVVYTS